MPLAKCLSGFEEPAVVAPATGELWICGDAGDEGRLGLGNTTDYSSPVQLGSATNWTVAFGGNQNNFAIRGGQLFGWGEGGGGYGGHNNTTDYSSPVQIGSLNTWDHGNCGRRIGLAIRTDGKLFAWGGINYQVSGIPNQSGGHISSPTLVGSKTDWNQLFVQSDTAAAIDDSGRLWAWGRNDVGQNGFTPLTTGGSGTPVPTQVGSLTTWRQVITSNSTRAIKTDGTLWSWGTGQSGVNGRGDTTAVSSPIQVGVLTDWHSVVGGGDWTVALKTDGTMWGWGNGIMTGGTGTNSSPVQIGSDSRWESITMGYSQNTIARTETGKLYVFGRGTGGCLGTGSTSNVGVPTQLGSLTTWMSGTTKSVQNTTGIFFKGPS